MNSIALCIYCTNEPKSMWIKRVRSFVDEIIMVHSVPGESVADSVNKALIGCESDYIMLMYSDEYISTAGIDEMKQLKESMTECSIAFEYHYNTKGNDVYSSDIIRICRRPSVHIGGEILANMRIVGDVNISNIVIYSTARTTSYTDADSMTEADRYEYAIRLYMNERYSKASKMFSQCITEIYSDKAKSWRAKISLKRGEYDNAKSIISSKRQLSAIDEYMMGQIYTYYEDYERAIYHYDHSMRINGGDRLIKDALFAIKTIYYITGNDNMANRYGQILRNME